MDIPPPWGVALVAAAVTAAMALIGLRWPDSSPARLSPPITHLLGGGLIGFTAIAFFPALPLVAAIAGMLLVRAAQASRWTDASLMAIGFGAVWTALLGYRMLSNALDPTFVGGSDLTLWLLVGAGVLVSGVLALFVVAVRADWFTPR